MSDVTFAVRVDDTDDLATIGKAYTGLTDAEIAEMTALLLDITTADHGHYRTVAPLIVLEIAFDAVQVSTRHNPGLRCVSHASRTGGTTRVHRRSTRCPGCATSQPRSSANVCNSSTQTGV